MSTSLIKSAQPTIERICKLLEDIKRLDVTPPDQYLPIEEQQQQYEFKKQIVKDQIKRFELHINTLESINQKWLEFIQQSTTVMKKKEEEKRHEKMIDDKQGILNLINSGKETIITLISYYDDFESAIQHMGPKDIKLSLPTHHSTINLPQLPLQIFSGNPKLWHEFWNSFNAAIHSQNIPDNLKLTYLISCLRGEALQSVRGYDIMPENYELIRQILIEKLANPSS